MVQRPKLLLKVSEAGEAWWQFHIRGSLKGLKEEVASVVGKTYSLANEAQGLKNHSRPDHTQSAGVLPQPANGHPWREHTPLCYAQSYLLSSAKSFLGA